MTALMETRMCRSLFRPLMVLALMLGGCANRASHLGSDLTRADNVCRQRLYRTQVEAIQCFDSAEKPIVAKNLPNLFQSYDEWNTARLTAAINFDRTVTLAKQDAATRARPAVEEINRKLSVAIAPFWTQSQKQQADAAVTAACKKDGLYRSPSMVVNFRCERDVTIPMVEKKAPVLSGAVQDYWNELLDIAGVYDGSVLPAIQQAGVSFKQAIEPAKAAYVSEVQAALQADTAETARQRQEVADLLAGIVQTTLAVVGTAAQVWATQYCYTHAC